MVYSTDGWNAVPRDYEEGQTARRKCKYMMEQVAFIFWLNLAILVLFVSVVKFIVEVEHMMSSGPSGEHYI